MFKIYKTLNILITPLVSLLIVDYTYHGRSSTQPVAITGPMYFTLNFSRLIATCNENNSAWLWLMVYIIFMCSINYAWLGRAVVTMILSIRFICCLCIIGISQFWLTWGNVKPGVFFQCVGKLHKLTVFNLRTFYKID